jgi:hypothetical protein
LGAAHMRNHIPAELRAEAFNCARCKVFAKQDWFYLQGTSTSTHPCYGSPYHNKEFTLSRCNSCSEPTIWHGESMIYPLQSTAESPSDDLPADVMHDYEEARLIASLSPRGAAALLRLALQKLCVHLGEGGKNINSDIASLVSKGLPAKVQQALDSVRVIGNESVHPGSLDLKDDHETVLKLFRLVNFVANKMITEPKEIESLYDSLPPDKLAGIAKRDGAS